MILCSSREIVSLKTFKKISGPPVFNSGWNEPSHALQFKWLDNTFNVDKIVTFFEENVSNINKN